MGQEMVGFWDAVASAGPYANNLHLAAGVIVIVLFCCTFIRQSTGWCKKKGTCSLRTTPATWAAAWMKRKSCRTKSSSLDPLAK